MAGIRIISDKILKKMNTNNNAPLLKVGRLPLALETPQDVSESTTTSSGSGGSSSLAALRKSKFAK